MRRYLAIVPAFNEAEAIAGAVAAIYERAPDFDVLVVDDGSIDATAERARSTGAEVLRMPFNLGIVRRFVAVEIAPELHCSHASACEDCQQCQNPDNPGATARVCPSRRGQARVFARFVARLFVARLQHLFGLGWHVHLPFKY